MKIIVQDLVGKNAISIQSGKKLYEKVYAPLKSGVNIDLDFQGVTVASPFLNSSIGLLLKDFDLEALQSQLKFQGMSDMSKSLLNHVIENAINYYSNHSNITQGIDKSLDDES